MLKIRVQDTIVYFSQHELMHVSTYLEQYSPHFSASSGRLLHSYTSIHCRKSSTHLLSQSSGASLLSVFRACAYASEDITRNSIKKFSRMVSLKEIRTWYWFKTYGKEKDNIFTWKWNGTSNEKNNKSKTKQNTWLDKISLHKKEQWYRENHAPFVNNCWFNIQNHEVFVDNSI